ncbi:nucleoside deaminase [Gammaproteobacteria bacterium]|nr:nucleoside deaminase [Gammaproteobacteria bacterium]
MTASRAYYRRLILRLLSLPLAGAVVPVSNAAASGASSDSVPGAADGIRFIRLALDLKRLAVKRGDQAYGAVIVRADLVVGRGSSRVIVDGDPTAHAEMEAIRDAARNLESRHLDGCVMYSTSRPCPMCEAAAYWAGLDRLFYGSDVIDGGPPRLTRC